jgi:homoserine dehydrogenase
MRIWLVGFGTVGQWLARVLSQQGGPLEARYGVVPQVVGIASAHDGFVYAPDGLDLTAALDAEQAGRPLAGLPGVRHWPSSLAGLRATEADLLVETSASPPEDGQPGLAHLREALARRIPVVTSNKWPVALDGVALAALARDQRVPFRAESTVMSGTPVLSALTEGLAGAHPVSVRGLLNATVNDILTRMAGGRAYPEALAAAQAAGLAEPDPGADVGGDDETAKVMILSALVFGRQLTRADVTCRGIDGLPGQAVDRARAAGGTLKHVASLSFAEPGGPGRITGPVTGPVSAGVQLEVVGPGDRLAGIDGAVNGLTCRADPVGEVTVIGPGAGPELAGQGVLSDLIAVARALQR